jgi:hypothetical protein
MPANHKLGAQANSQFTQSESGNPYRLFWGDLHNHNAVGYAKGSLQRSIDLAREHLDFFAFTGHASWHDMPKMPGDRHMKWVNGFDVHKRHWPKTKQMIREANSDDFVALLGYEWHSSKFGDYCVIHPDDAGDLYLPNDVNKLLDFSHNYGSLAIPHHLAYAQGWRGANFKHFRAEASPVVEIFSEHGCSESDRSPHPFIRHSMSGRSTANTVEYQLARGMQFGFVASSDDHRGYPGAYGEGVVGVWANDLSRESLFEAIENRRTYAATGDRIALEVSVNEQPMGASVDYVADRQIDVQVTAQDSIQMIELVRNGRVIERHFPEDHHDGKVKLPGTAKCRVQYGWGPWAALGLGRVCDWDLTIGIKGGKILKALPCFQTGPFEEDKRDRLRFKSDSEVHLTSNTSRVLCYSEDPTKAIVLELEGNPDSVLYVKTKTPVEQTVTAKLADLIDDNVVTITGVFTSESHTISRLISPNDYTARIRWSDNQKKGLGLDWYYVRVTQHNGHQAWSSPVWVG